VPTESAHLASSAGPVPRWLTEALTASARQRLAQRAPTSPRITRSYQRRGDAKAIGATAEHDPVKVFGFVLARKGRTFHRDDVPRAQRVALAPTWA
jgi:hypothetical protein